MQTISTQAPVLFLVFNRLEATRQVFEAIRAARPPRLYIAADGPREDRQGEAERVQAVRDHVMSSVDWPCEVKTLFREANLGCKQAVSQAITWFFDQEESGLIIEDDCLPTQGFFEFCNELLPRYRNDLRVWQISGTNFNFGQRRDPDYSYYYSYYGSIWGWATWRDRWQHYDVEMRGYDEVRKKGYLTDLFGNKEEAESRMARFDKIRDIDTWDFQWTYTRFINSGLAVMPVNNLVTNLGFGSDATHTHAAADIRAHMQTTPLTHPLRHPSFVIRDKASDDLYFQRFIRQNNNVLGKLREIARKILSR